MSIRSALLVVDVQLDFCPGGALPVPEGDTIIPVLNKYMKLFSGHKLPVFASRDWHARQTKHFQEFGGTWPQHCVEHTEGAQFHPVLTLPAGSIILSKGMSCDGDSYSAFQAVDDQNTAFDVLLRRHEITSLFIGGLATDYCVKWTVLDALKYGYKATLLIDAIKGVNIKPRDSEVAIDEMTRLGAQSTTFERLYKAMAETGTTVQKMEVRTMTTPQHCPGYEKFKNLSSFNCRCPNCGKEYEIFSDEFDRKHTCKACGREIDFTRCQLYASGMDTSPR